MQGGKKTNHDKMWNVLDIESFEPEKDPIESLNDVSESPATQTEAPIDQAESESDSENESSADSIVSLDEPSDAPVDSNESLNDPIDQAESESDSEIELSAADPSEPPIAPTEPAPVHPVLEHLVDSLYLLGRYPILCIALFLKFYSLSQDWL